MLLTTAKTVSTTVIASAGIYFTLLGLLATIPWLQTHVFYLHRVTLTWFKDVDVPEQFGFAPAQVSPFYITAADRPSLHAWHVLPLGPYRRNRKKLIDAHTSSTTGVSEAALDILKTNPEARLVLYFHGTAGCLASGWRPDSYRAISAAAPDHIHVLTFDYRGYGLSSGTPSEQGLFDDGVAVVEWAMKEARIPPERIVIYAQSLGTAVALSLVEHYASLPTPILFAGHVLTATFSDVATLLSTYRIGGIIPVLSPLRKLPRLLSFFTSFLHSTWQSKDRIAGFVRYREKSTEGQQYFVNLIHAEDDADITCEHSNVVYWHAVNATIPESLSYSDFGAEKLKSKTDLKNGGWIAEHRTGRGYIRQTMLSFGLHDKLMSYSVISLAILEAFQWADPSFCA